MIVVKSILGLVIGAILGVVLSVGLIYPLLVLAEGGRDMNGGIAMGMVTSVAPMGAILGAIAGLTFVLMGKANRPRGRSLAISLGVFALAYAAFFLFLKGPQRVAMADEPDIYFEFRTSAASVQQSDDFQPYAELFGHAADTHLPIQTTLSVEGDYAILSGTLHYQLNKGYEKMRLRAVLSPDLIVDATTPLFPGLEVVPGMTEWRAVDFITMPISDETELGYSQDVHMVRHDVRRREP